MVSFGKLSYSVVRRHRLFMLFCHLCCTTNLLDFIDCNVSLFCHFDDLIKTKLYILKEMQIEKRLEKLKKGKAKDSQSKVKVRSSRRSLLAAINFRLSNNYVLEALPEYCFQSMFKFPEFKIVLVKEGLSLTIES